MITYLKMKKSEWKIKVMLYKAIFSFFDNQKEVLNLLQKIYINLKDIPAEELQREFISKLAEIIHEENT